jgi:uncharacterized membrane protein YhfC
LLDILFITHLLNGLLMILIPVGFVLYLTHKFKLGMRLWWIGGATFILSQVGHIPFNAALSSLIENGIIPIPPNNYQLLFYAIIFGLSAGIWESIARYAMFRWWAKDARNWIKGVLVGAGHGGAESIILGVIVLANFISMVVARNIDVNTLTSPEQISSLQSQLQTYWDIPWYFPLIGVTERIFTIIVHISLSLMVMQAFTRKNILWLGLAIAWHSFLDGLAIYASQTLDPIVTEAVIGSIAVFSLGIIFALKQTEQDEAEVNDWISFEDISESQGTSKQTPSLTDLDGYSEQLDQSRFD